MDKDKKKDDKPMMKKDDKPKMTPMDKNGLGEHLPSRKDVKEDNQIIQTAQGAPVPNNQNRMTSGVCGPMMMQDM